MVSLAVCFYFVDKSSVADAADFLYHRPQLCRGLQHEHGAVDGRERCHASWIDEKEAYVREVVIVLQSISKIDRHCPKGPFAMPARENSAPVFTSTPPSQATAQIESPLFVLRGGICRAAAGSASLTKGDCIASEARQLELPKNDVPRS